MDREFWDDKRLSVFFGRGKFPVQQRMGARFSSFPLFSMFPNQKVGISAQLSPPSGLESRGRDPGVRRISKAGGLLGNPNRTCVRFFWGSGGKAGDRFLLKCACFPVATGTDGCKIRAWFYQGFMGCHPF